MSVVLPAAPPPPAKTHGFWRRSMRHPSFVIGLVLTGAVMLAVLMMRVPHKRAA